MDCNGKPYDCKGLARPFELAQSITDGSTLQDHGHSTALARNVQIARSGEDADGSVLRGPRIRWVELGVPGSASEVLADL